MMFRFFYSLIIVENKDKISKSKKNAKILTKEKK